jgi:hypothetical protein
MKIIGEKVKTIACFDCDTSKHIFDIEVYKASENHIRGYVAMRLDGTQIGETRFFIEHVVPLKIIAAFKKEIREKNIKL